MMNTSACRAEMMASQTSKPEVGQPNVAGRGQVGHRTGGRRVEASQRYDSWQ